MNRISLAGKVDWIFFDLGNTLVDEDLAWQDRVTQLATVLRDEGFSYDERQVTEAIFTASVERAPFHKHLERLYPEAITTLQRLSRQFSLGVIANQSPGTAARLETFGIAPYISVCVASAEEGVAKPDPEIYRRALLRANCPPERAVMIGDRVDNDIAPAKALGMFTIRVLKGFARTQLPQCNEEISDFTISSIADLPPIIGIG